MQVTFGKGVAGLFAAVENSREFSPTRPDYGSRVLVRPASAPSPDRGCGLTPVIPDRCAATQPQLIR